jgi:hypothetical protein
MTSLLNLNAGTVERDVRSRTLLAIEIAAPRRTSTGREISGAAHLGTGLEVPGMAPRVTPGRPPARSRPRAAARACRRRPTARVNGVGARGRRAAPAVRAGALGRSPSRPCRQTRSRRDRSSRPAMRPGRPGNRGSVNPPTTSPCEASHFHFQPERRAALFVRRLAPLRDDHPSRHGRSHGLASSSAATRSSGARIGNAPSRARRSTGGRPVTSRPSSHITSKTG